MATPRRSRLSRAILLTLIRALPIRSRRRGKMQRRPRNLLNPGGPRIRARTCPGAVVETARPLNQKDTPNQNVESQHNLKNPKNHRKSLIIQKPRKTVRKKGMVRLSKLTSRQKCVQCTTR